MAAMLTREASKQTYFTIRTLVPPGRRDDALRAYAYFRWLDDRIDGDALTPRQRSDFIDSQKILLACCFENHPPRALLSEEWLLVDLTQGPLGHDPGLRTYLRGMMTLMEFDARRRNHRINQRELEWYSHTLATAVTEAVYTFIGGSCGAPRTSERYLAADGAHIVHMLRDLYDDLDAGYINIPAEVLSGKRIDAEAVHSECVRRWVQERIETARNYLKAGSDYLASVRNPRCRVAGAWYAARFEGVLNAIEREGYRLRRDYRDCKGARAALRMFWNGLHAALPQSPARQSAPTSMPSFVAETGPAPLPILQHDERLRERVDL
jgi:phytoene/squalene synthetase